MVKLSEHESLALRIIRRWQEHYSNSPTIEELAKEMHVAYDTARYALHKLNDKGFVDMMYPMNSKRLLIKPLYWE
jgi:Mn-dependent DtxR family transcriptional regulator